MLSKSRSNFGAMTLGLLGAVVLLACLTASSILMVRSAQAQVGSMRRLMEVEMRPVSRPVVVGEPLLVRYKLTNRDVRPILLGDLEEWEHDWTRFSLTTPEGEVIAREPRRNTPPVATLPIHRLATGRSLEGTLVVGKGVAPCAAGKFVLQAAVTLPYRTGEGTPEQVLRTRLNIPLSVTAPDWDAPSKPAR